MKTYAIKSEKGFTLIETCIALVVMMVAALAVVSLFVYSMQNNVGGSDRALAMAVGQQQLEQLRSVDFDDASLDAGVTQRTIRNSARDYDVVTTIANETNPGGTGKLLKRLTIRVTPLTAAHTWQRSSVVLVSFRSTLAPGAYAAQ